jgi:hypothetical protein
MAAKKKATAKPSQSFSAPVPILRIFDEQKARDFYVGYLGFAVDFAHRFEPGLPIYMQVSRDSCILQLSEHSGDGTPGTKVKIPTKDVVAYNAVLRAKKYRYARPGVMDMEWGERQMTINDPFGNAIIFFQRI